MIKSEKSKSYIYPLLPKTGLANMLFVWGRAEVASIIHNMPIIAPQWIKIFRFGPWRRREKDKRYYFGDFVNDKYISGIRRLMLLAFGKRVPEESLFETHYHSLHPSIFVFEGYKEYFNPLLVHGDFLHIRLLEITNPKIVTSIHNCKERFIGVHVRRGDFKHVNQIIPTEWYANTCREIRNHFGHQLKIKIFTDAHRYELGPLLELANSEVVEGKAAIHDLLMLAKSRIIVGTSLSTFSLWASFLGKCLTFWPPVSPGVYGYGLHTNQHITADWNGKFNLECHIDVPVRVRYVDDLFKKSE
jgi:hypothetical protein